MTDHLPTGTGANRRRLTLDEAMRGERPEPYTVHEWKALHLATMRFPGPTQWAVSFNQLSEAIDERR